MPEKTVNVEIDANLWDQFKTVSRALGYTLKGATTVAIRDWLNSQHGVTTRREYRLVEVEHSRLD